MSSGAKELPASAHFRAPLSAGSLAHTHRWHRLTSWYARDDELGRTEGLLGRLVTTEPTPAEVAELDALLGHSRPRYLCFALLEMLGADPTRVLTAQRAEEYAEWRRLKQIDEEVTQLARGWSAGCAGAVHYSTDVTVGVDYLLVRALLTDHYAVFRGNPE